MFGLLKMFKAFVSGVALASVSATTVAPSGEPSSRPSHSPTAACPPGYDLCNDKCYKYVRSTVTYSSCESACSAESAKMLCINDLSENSCAASKNNDNSVNTDYWLGYTKTFSSFSWYSGCSSFFTYWAAGEPTSNGDTCSIGYDVNGYWYDEACSASNNCICQKNKNSASNIVANTPLMISLAAVVTMFSYLSA